MKTRSCYAYTYRFKQAVQIYSLTHYAKGTPASTLMWVDFDCLQAKDFSVSFTPLMGYCFSFPSRY